MRPINNYVHVIHLAAPASHMTGVMNNLAGGGATQPTPGKLFQQVTALQADVSQPWGNSLELYITIPEKALPPTTLREQKQGRWRETHGPDLQPNG